MDGIAPLTSLAGTSQAYAVAKDLGLAPAIVIALCYLHFLVGMRPIAVRVLTILEALFSSANLPAEKLADAKATAELEVGRPPAAAGIFNLVRAALGKTAILALAISLAVGCAAASRLDTPRVHETAVKVQHGLELELRATAPVSSAHALQREALRADVAELVSATQ